MTVFTRTNVSTDQFQNHFVTPFTSLVVVQPDKENCKDYEEDDTDEDESSDTRHKDPSADPSPDTINYTASLDSQDSVARGFNPASIQVSYIVFLVMCLFMYIATAVCCCVLMLCMFLFKTMFLLMKVRSLSTITSSALC